MALNDLDILKADSLADLAAAQTYLNVFVQSEGDFYYWDGNSWEPTNQGGGGGLTIPATLTDDDSDTTANYASFTLNIEFDGEAALPTTLVNLGLASRITYGENNADTQGTLHCFTSTFDVMQSGQPNSEMANWMGWQRFRLNEGNVGRAWFADFSLLGSDEQQQQLNGITMLVNNYFDGSPTGGPSCAFVAVSAQGKGAGGEEGHNTAQTYPVNIGFACVGHSGIPGGGGEDRGFDYGFKVGRNASGWMVPTEETLVGVGFQGDGYDTACFVIGQPATTGVPGIALASFDGGGATTFSHVIDFNNATMDDIASGGSLIRLANVADVKSGILFGGSGTRLHVGANNIAQITGKLGVGGAMTESTTLLEVVGSVAVSDPLFKVGSPGVNDANSFRFENGTAGFTSFISGNLNQFMTGTLAGDGGFRVDNGQKLWIGDQSGPWAYYSAGSYFYNIPDSTPADGFFLNGFGALSQDGSGVILKLKTPAGTVKTVTLPFD